MSNFIDKCLVGLRDWVKRSVIIKRYHEGDFCDDGIVVYLNYDDGYINPHM